ncbi:TRAP transporter TatT component family protein [Desulfogranum mediterraneum]|uniref:TRAP transporter TatT component family protein n=1 Tax=Desulfogranum mediterraneum TaxID=160661 RepID=UPI001ABF2ACE|nr:TRAP transporter TatT component family protein [Desulfogranum mediterraneum]
MKYGAITLLLTLLTVLSGCARMVAGSFIRPTLANLQRQTDIELVCEGTPSFLLMMDSMLASSPRDKQLLLTATQAFSGYAAALDECNRPERAVTVSNKARLYGMSLLWNGADPQEVSTLPLADLEQTLAELDRSRVDHLFWAGNGWSTWIRHQQGSPASLAQLVRVEQIMLRVLELDESYYHGGAHLFLGSYYGSKPKLLGGKPMTSRAHFERALALGKRQFLPALVLYARSYARMAFDRELFVKLLEEVLDFPLESRPDLGLANQLARRQAARLLEQTDQFF